MNIFDEIQGSRPDVAPMPLAKRRIVRESLFGLGHDDSTRTITGRSESGAVVSTAPHGMRRPIQKRPRPAGSFAKLGAGLLLLAGVGAVAWSYSTRDDDTVESVAATTTTTTATTTTTTVAPTTTAPIVRTGVGASAPLALPALALTVDEVVTSPAVVGSSSAVLMAPDGTEVWLAEFDGDPLDASGLDVRQVGAIGVGVDANRAPDAPPSYRPQVPCGVVIVNDAPDQPLDRQPMIDLFAAMSIDGDATIDVNVPTDWSIFSVGESVPTYVVQFQVPVPGDDTGATTPVRLTQAPGGSLAQLMFGGRQLEPIDFLGLPAYIDIGSPNGSLTSVYWQDADTVFNVSSDAATVEDLEAFVESLEPVAVDDWDQQFAPPEPEPAPEPSACAPQPGFGPSLTP